MLSFLLLVTAFISQAEATLTIYSFHFDSSPPDNWSITGSIVQENISCPSPGICWDIKGSGMIQRSVSLLGFHTISIQIDVAQNGLENSNDYCQIEYKDPNTNDWSSPVFRYRSSNPVIAATNSLPNDNTINNQSIFLFRLLNTATNTNNDHCYFDNLIIFGIMYPTPNPTTNPTLNPTTQPTVIPTNNPTFNPTQSPSTNPTISLSFTDQSVFVSTSDIETHSGEQINKSNGIDITVEQIIIIVMGIFIALILFCIVGSFCYKRSKRNESETIQHNVSATMDLNDNMEKQTDLRKEGKAMGMEIITIAKTDDYDSNSEELFNDTVVTENEHKNKKKQANRFMSVVSSDGNVEELYVNTAGQQITTGYGHDDQHAESDENNELYTGNASQTTKGSKGNV